MNTIRDGYLDKLENDLCNLASLAHLVASWIEEMIGPGPVDPSKNLYCFDARDADALSFLGYQLRCQADEAKARYYAAFESGAISHHTAGAAPDGRVN